MTRAQLIAALKRLDACDEARDWVAATKGSPAQLWAMCPRGDWLMWLARRSDAIDRWTAADLACRTFAPLALEAAKIPDWPERLRALPPVTDQQSALRARDLCCEAHDAAAYAAEAAEAADAAYDAARAAARAAADAVAAEAADAAYYKSLRQARKRVADVVRKRITWAAIERALEKKEVA